MRCEYSNKELASLLFNVLIFGTFTKIELFTKPGIGIVADGAGIGILHLPPQSGTSGTFLYICIGLDHFILVLDWFWHQIYFSFAGIFTFYRRSTASPGIGVPASGTVW
jgi:hypothetical protein